MSGVETVEDIEASRKNGWTWPPNPLQILAWLILIILALVYFLTLAPTIHSSWQPAVYTIPAVALLVHLICHLITLTIDPADPRVIQKKLPKVKFDRSKHSHVIEDGYCYICRSDVANNSKHCCICNKCISDFDHHCKWLSTCIGGRNYRWFLATLVTGIVALVLVTALSLAEFIAYFTDQDNRCILQPYRELNSTDDYMTAQFQLFYGDVPHIAWLVVLAIYIVLGVIAIVLVTHLFGFHIYLIIKNLSTYDYIIIQRDKEEDMKAAKEVQHYSNLPSTSARTNRKNQVLPSTACSGSKSARMIRKTTTESSQTPDIDIPPTEGQSYSVNREAGNWSDGETPPPSASPIHVENNNNNNNHKEFKIDYTDKTEIKRLRKKRRKRSSSSSNHTSVISTIDNPRMYKDKDYTIARVDIPPIVTRPILPPPVPSPKGVMGASGEYHSDTADSLLEVPPDKNVNAGTFGTLNSSNFGTLNSSLNLSFDATDGERKRVKKRVKKKKLVQEVDESDDELNSTTLFTVNSSAKVRSDGSLEYKDFKNLPLTPQMLRKKNNTTDDKHELDDLKPIVNERRYAKREDHDRRNTKLSHDEPKLSTVPPLDFSALRGSHESVSFQPYTATFRSTDTVITDRLLPTLKEERQKLHTVMDTEI